MTATIVRSVVEIGVSMDFRGRIARDTRGSRSRIVSLGCGAATVIVILITTGCATTTAAWEEARQTHSIHAYKQFVKQHPDSEYVPLAKQKIEALAWNDAQSRNDVQAYRTFISSYPQSSYVLEAKNRISVLTEERWQRTQYTDSAQEYRRFASQFPDSQHARAALEKADAIERMAWEETVKAGTAEAYEDFIHRHADSRLASQAATELAKIEWEETAKAGTAEAYASFVRKHPDSSFASQAVAELDRRIEAEYERASRDLKSLQRFVRIYPLHTRSKEWQQKIEDRFVELLLSSDIGDRFVIGAFTDVARKDIAYREKGSVTVFETGTTGIVGFNLEYPKDRQPWRTGGAYLPMGHGSIWRFKGRVANVMGVTFNGEKTDPLRFVLVEGKGLVYLYGKGQVVRYGSVVDLPQAQSQPTSEIEYPVKDETETRSAREIEKTGTLGEADRTVRIEIREGEGQSSRRVIDLNGTWQVAEGTMDSIPKQFDHTVPVPGLVDMAQPAFADVGKKSEKRQVFWYRRSFAVTGGFPEVAILKIHKARYGTKVWLNGQVVGEHLPSFTPARLDVKPHLKGSGQENDLIVRVGADRESRPTDVPSGWDFEKYLYIPGIYDSVELILSGEPFIQNIQTIPDIEARQVRVIAEIRSSAPSLSHVTCEVSEARSGRVAGRIEQSDVVVGGDHVTRLDMVIPLQSCRLWSPEDPFLYRLKLSTGGDTAETRFGMRSFRFDRESGRAILNGKPYFMRGTNVCAYRFFEDAERGDKPWRADWVRRLHQRFKSMHWNAIRYCIGFPPEIWYDIADEEGFLIQDEFPIWLLGEAPEKPKAEKIIPEYVEWMRERWNHPCVVIWDAQNESVTPETGKALQAVRHLDLSNRPWENGWAETQNLSDFVEAHPYLFSTLFNPSWGRKDFTGLKDMVNISGVPRLRDAQRKLGAPIVINEYAWLWLNRDGTPTCLTANVYEKLLGPNSTTEQRRLLYAKYLAALTEFWRGHRECAGVLHFCGLGYSRAGDKPRPEGGATSDHFIDLEKLIFEPNFESYVRDAFSPVGLMLDYWGQDLPAGKRQEVKVFVINDRYQACQVAVRLRLLNDDAMVASPQQSCTVRALGREIVSFTLPVPSEPGAYTLVAELIADGQKPVRSVRDATVVATTK